MYVVAVFETVIKKYRSENLIAEGGYVTADTPKSLPGCICLYRRWRDMYLISMQWLSLPTI